MENQKNVLLTSEANGALGSLNFEVTSQKKYCVISSKSQRSETFSPTLSQQTQYGCLTRKKVVLAAVINYTLYFGSHQFVFSLFKQVRVY